MATINKRNTIQRALILDAVRQLDSHPTADDIFAAVSAKCPGISKGTVYRNLNVLADEGEILRVAVANAPDRFDRTTGDHCHFRCLKCGRVFDFGTVSNECIKAENDSGSGCVVTGYDIVFRGYCPDCAKK